MVPDGLDQFHEVWCVDTEFSCPPGERQQPVCLVAYELRSRRTIALWQDELFRLRVPPYATDARTLIIAYYASAELGTHLALGWPLPLQVLDLYVEFRNQTNGRPPICGSGLIGALTHYGLKSISALDKDEMRKLALRGGPWTADERAALLAYCKEDVKALVRLLPRMVPMISVPHALLRGRYMRAAAHIEYTGTPIDTGALEILNRELERAKDRLVERVDHEYGVYDGRIFKLARWEAWVTQHQLPWPRLASGRLSLDEGAFHDMAIQCPKVAPIKDLRYVLAKMRLADLAVGADGRNRVLLSVFGAKTGRNAPSSSQFIFGPAVWLRHLIRPRPGYGLAYIDWSQQEFGIAAYLSGDPTMMQAYESGDPYLAFAKQAGAVPPDGDRDTHGHVREQFKQCALALQYGMEKDSLAGRIALTPSHARRLLQFHKDKYPVFWRWSDAAVDLAMLGAELSTTFGWIIRVGSNANPRSLRNFPMQANGAEMLRLACCYATERGVAICAPIHDAILIEAPLSELDQKVNMAQQAMSDASADVLGGFRLRSTPKIIPYPDHYRDDRGNYMWDLVWDVIRELNSESILGGRGELACAPVDHLPVHR